jgi:hypothetical protein
MYAMVQTTDTTEDWNRHWGTHNVLIEFDEKGLVKRYRAFPDSELFKELAARVAESPNRSLDLSKPMEIRVLLHLPKDTYLNSTIVLGNDSFEFREDEGGRVHNFKISPKQIRKLTLTSPAHTHWSNTLSSRWGLSPRYMNGIIHFTEKTPAASELTIRVDVPTVMVLVKYLAQTRSN